MDSEEDNVAQLMRELEDKYPIPLFVDMPEGTVTELAEEVRYPTLSSWDQPTLEGKIAKLLQCYVPSLVMLVITLLGLYFVQWMEWTPSWWLVLPVGIIFLVHADWMHRHTEQRAKRMLSLHRTLLYRQAKEARYLYNAVTEHLLKKTKEMALKRETEERRFADLKRAVQSAMGSPANQVLAIQAVNALLNDEPFPAAVATLSKAEADQYYADRREIDITEHYRLRGIAERWMPVSDVLREVVQQLWESRREGNHLPSANARRTLVRLLHDHWGRQSYAYKFLKDLGATQDVS